MLQRYYSIESWARVTGAGRGQRLPNQQIVPFRVGWDVRMLRYRAFERACHEHNCNTSCVQHDDVIHRGAKQQASCCVDDEAAASTQFQCARTSPLHKQVSQHNSNEHEF